MCYILKYVPIRNCQGFLNLILSVFTILLLNKLFTDTGSGVKTVPSLLFTSQVTYRGEVGLIIYLLAANT